MHNYNLFKALVWDQSLTDQFGLIAEYPLLKEHEVDRMFSLNGGKLPKSSVQHIIFITRPKLDQMDFIAQNIQKEEEGTGFGKEFHVFFVPWKSYLCVQKLEVLFLPMLLVLYLYHVLNNLACFLPIFNLLNVIPMHY